MIKNATFLLRAVIHRTYTSMSTSFQLQGKVAVVTASTDGIGLAIARGLAENGAKVMISSRKQENVDKALKLLKDDNLQVSGIVCHVAKKKDRDALFEKVIDEFGQLDILVSNAAVSPHFGPTLQTSEKAWDKLFDVNLKSSFLLAQQAAPLLKKTKGSMLFVSSIGAYIPSKYIGVYSITKTALVAMVKVLSAECAADGIRVNAIAPGIIETGFSSALIENASSQMLETCPMKRFGRPSECAGAVVFLSSDAASYITGEVIAMTGGFQSRL